MSKNLTNEEFVNSYLDNELSEIDRLDFENQLLHDSELKEEYNFQKDLVEGIKEARRIELKSRLNNIPISTPVYQTLGFKAIAIASITAGVGIGAFYLFNEKDSIQLSDIDLTDNKTSLKVETEIPTIPEVITPIFERKSNEEKIMDVIAQEKPKADVIAKNVEVIEKPQVIQPTIIQPDIVENFEEEEIGAEEIELDNQINDIDNIKENIESTVEIATVRDKRNKFHYKFFENKLYLLGNFNEMPYEIIELNSSQGKSYFLYYNESFYKLNQEQVKPTRLIKIVNDSLVNELRIIQSNQQQN